jgi:hydroxyacylglutathione hydrolase
MTLPDLEFVDRESGALVRRLSVGPLDPNCWIVADPATSDAIVIDPGDEPHRILDAVTDLRVQHVVLTHAHWDHVLGVPMLQDALGISPMLHPDDSPVWPHEQRHLAEHGRFDAGTATSELLACGCTLRPPDGEGLWDGTAQSIEHGDVVRCASVALIAIATPGHTPGSISLRLGRRVFTGDTLFPGGPGLTGWPLSDFSAIIDSIDRRLFALPDDTVVHPGHGRDTTIGAERPSLPEWVQRGW